MGLLLGEFLESVIDLKRILRELHVVLCALYFFYLFFVFERSSEDFNKKDIDYQKFRKILTLLVCISFLISIGYWINPYSNPYL